MPDAVARANARKSEVRAGVEHVFARHEGSDGAYHPAGQGESENRPRQSHLQHETDALADDAVGDGINRPNGRPQPNRAAQTIKIRSSREHER
jgi:hypothetical protein